MTEAETKVRSVYVADKVQAIWGQTDRGLARDVCLRCGDAQAGKSSGQQLLCLRHTILQHAAAVKNHGKTFERRLNGSTMSPEICLPELHG